MLAVKSRQQDTIISYSTCVYNVSMVINNAVNMLMVMVCALHYLLYLTILPYVDKQRCYLTKIQCLILEQEVRTEAEKQCLGHTSVPASSSHGMTSCCPRRLVGCIGHCAWPITNIHPDATCFVLLPHCCV